MKLQLKHVLPSRYELMGFAVGAICTLLIENSQKIVHYYGLGNSGAVIKTAADTVVQASLARADSIAFTDEVVTFGIWALVGLVCVSMVFGVLKTLQAVKLEEEVSSKKYVHPPGFSQPTFWKWIGFEIGETILCAVAVVGSILMFLLVCVPGSIRASQAFFADISIANIGGVVLGMAILYLGLYLLGVCVRLFLFRRRLLPIE